jgi:RimJ/RimL family protein N-acetyltransferase
VSRWRDVSDPAGWLANEIAERAGPTRAICLAGTGQAVGRIAVRGPEHASSVVRCAAVRRSDQPVGELSYWVDVTARGRGVATAAVRAMLGLVAATTPLHSVVFDIETDNTASQRVAARAGARRRAPARVVEDRDGQPRTLEVWVARI